MSVHRFRDYDDVTDEFLQNGKKLIDASGKDLVDSFEHYEAADWVSNYVSEEDAYNWETEIDVVEVIDNTGGHNERV